MTNGETDGIPRAMWTRCKNYWQDDTNTTDDAQSMTTPSSTTGITSSFINSTYHFTEVSK